MAYAFFKLNIIPLLRLKIKKVEGLENISSHGNFIFAANHNSWIDSPFFIAGLTKVFKEKIYFVSVTKKFKWLGTIPIDRKNKGKTVEKALNYLKKSKNIFLFIEGNSNPDKTLNEPKTGVARLALRSRLPVIPMGIAGTKGVSFISAFLRFWLTPARAKIKIGRAMTFEEYYNQEENEALLHKVSRLVLQEISGLCGKKMPAEDFNL